jgi:caffeoyl-CoA O-methyltransferase
MEFIHEKINAYAEQHSTPETTALKNLNRETQVKILMPRMVSGHLQGRVLSMLSHMIKPMNILEIGTYTGYSAICLAEGLQEGGVLHTIDVNEELTEMVNKYVNEAGFTNKIQAHVGKALDIIPTLNYEFDMVFIDADKVNNAAYYDLVFDKVRKGGYIITDNVLWSGKVVNEKLDTDTKIIIDFNAKVHNDPRVENVLLPIRDGLLVARKL